MSADNNREKLIRAGISRDERCAASLRVSRLEDLQLSNQPGACFLVTMIGDSAKCKTCLLPDRCMCLRDHFQSTNNSKRRVSTHLFWKNKLGLSFPVADKMLTKAVWGALSSCENGIKEGNGQRKKPNGAVCVNPYCYKPVNYFKVMKPMAQTFAVLGIDQEDIIAGTLRQLGWNGIDFTPPAGVEPVHVQKGFELISAVVRQMSFKGPYAAPQSDIQAGPAVADAAAATSLHQQMQLQLLQQQQANLAMFQRRMREQERQQVKQEVQPNAAGIIDLPVPRPYASPQPDETISTGSPSDTGYVSASSANSSPEYTPTEYYQTALPPEYYAAAPAAGAHDLGDAKSIAESIVSVVQEASWSHSERKEIFELEKLLRGEDISPPSDGIDAERVPETHLAARPEFDSVQLTPDTATFPADLDGVDSSWLAYIDAETLVAPTGQMQVMSGLSIPSVSAARKMTSAEQIAESFPKLPYGQASPVLPTSQIFTSPQPQLDDSSGATAVSFGSISTVHGGQVVQQSNLTKRPDGKTAKMAEGGNGSTVRSATTVCRSFCRECRRWMVTEERPKCCTVGDCASDDLFVERVSTDRAPVLPAVEAADDLEEGDIVGVLGHAGTVSVVRLDASQVQIARGVGVISQSREGERMMCMMGNGRIKVRGSIRSGQTIFASLRVNADTAGVAKPSPKYPPIAVGRALEDVDAADQTSVNLVRAVIFGTGARMAGKIAPALVATINHSFKTKLVAEADTESASRALAELSLSGNDKRSVTEDDVATFRRLDGKTPEDESVIMLRSGAAGGVPLSVGADGTVGCLGPDGPASWWVVHANEDGKVRLQGALSDDLWLCTTASGTLTVVDAPDVPGTLFTVGKDSLEAGDKLVQVRPDGNGAASFCDAGAELDASTMLHAYVRHACATLVE